MNWQMPKRVTGRILSQVQQKDAPHSVPTEFSGELFFENGTSAAFFCSFIAENQQWAVVSGEKGLLRVNDFVLPFKGDQTHYSVTQSQFQVRNCQFDMVEGRRDITVAEPSNNAPRSQEAELFRTFSDLMIKGSLDSHWPFISLQTQTVMEACLRSARENSGIVPL
jgi:predicted dehydrogenase